MASLCNVGLTSSNLVLTGGNDILRCQMLKETYYTFFSFPSVFYISSCACKDFESEKGQSLHQQKLLSPTENAAPETPRQ